MSDLQKYISAHGDSDMCPVQGMEAFSNCSRFVLYSEAEAQLNEARGVSEGRRKALEDIENERRAEWAYNENRIAAIQSERDSLARDLKASQESLVAFKNDHGRLIDKQGQTESERDTFSDMLTKAWSERDSALAAVETMKAALNDFKPFSRSTRDPHP